MKSESNSWKMSWLSRTVFVMMMMMISSSHAFGGIASSSVMSQSPLLSSSSLTNRISVSSSWKGKQSLLSFQQQQQQQDLAWKNKNRMLLLLFGSRAADDDKSTSLISSQRKRFSFLRVKQSCVKWMKVICMMGIVWNFSFHSNNNLLTSTPPSAHAATTTTTTTSRLERRLVDDYVRKYMFQDDVYDPMESAYRETLSSKAYKKELSDTVSQVLGKSAVVPSSTQSAKDAGANIVVKVLTSIVNVLTNRFKLPSTLAYLIVTTTTFIFPFILFSMAGLMFSRAQRSMTDRMAAQRYGDDNVDLDATEVIDDDDDDDDDDENLYGQDDDDDDDSDDDDDDSDDDE